MTLRQPRRPVPEPMVWGRFLTFMPAYPGYRLYGHVDIIGLELPAHHAGAPGPGRQTGCDSDTKTHHPMTTVYEPLPSLSPRLV